MKSAALNERTQYVSRANIEAWILTGLQTIPSLDGREVQIKLNIGDLVTNAKSGEKDLIPITLLYKKDTDEGQVFKFINAKKK